MVVQVVQVVVVQRWRRSIETGAKSTRGQAENRGEETQGIGPTICSRWLCACVPFEVGDTCAARVVQTL
jgi:hypothetical protein